MVAEGSGMIPDQHPVRRKVALRPRTDRYTLPRFPQPDRPLRPEPFDGGEWDRYAEDPKPLTLDDLKDPSVWVGGGLVFAAIVVLLIVFLSSGPYPA